MKVLLATINYDHPQKGMKRAFDYVFGSENVREYDYLENERRGRTLEENNQTFKAFATWFQPDWIFLQVQETNIIQAETLKQIKAELPKTIITHWTGDYRPTVSPYLASICQTTDITFISSVGQLSLFEKTGAKEVHYLQIGVDWEEDVLGIPPWNPPFEVPPVVFIGNHYGDYFPEGTSQRLATIRALQDALIPIGVVGSGWPSDIHVVGTCGVKQQHHVYKKAKVAINVNHINNVNRYYSDRQLIAMASGTPVVCWYVPGLDLDFRIEGYGDPLDECLGFTRIPQAVDFVTKLLSNPTYAKCIGQNGRRAVMQRHDWINRIHDALQIVEDVAEKTKSIAEKINQ